MHRLARWPLRPERRVRLSYALPVLHLEVPLQEQYKQWLESDAARWEDAAASRREWVRRGWATAKQMAQEIEWYEGRAENSRFLLSVC